MLNKSGGNRNLARRMEKEKKSKQAGESPSPEKALHIAQSRYWLQEYFMDCVQIQHTNAFFFCLHKVLTSLLVL